MSFRIVLSCQCKDFSEGLSNMIKEDKNGAEVLLLDDEEEIINAGPDLLITDFATLCSFSMDNLFEQKISTLLIATNHFPEMNKDRLFELISKGLVGII